MLVLVTSDADAWTLDTGRAGARGCLLKDTGREELFAAIKGEVAGEASIDALLARNC